MSFSAFAVAQEHNTFTIPFDLQAGLILLKGELNGKPGSTFLLDTTEIRSVSESNAHF